MLRITVAVFALATGGCVRFLPEATVTTTGPIEEVLAPIAAASGLHSSDVPTREVVAEDELRRSLDVSMRIRPAAGTGALDEVIRAFFALPDREHAVSSAAADPWPGVRSAYDADTERVLLPGSGSETGSSDGPGHRAWRRGELDRLRAFCAAMHHDALKLGAAQFEDVSRSDRNDALLAVIEGGAFAAVLEASLAPVNAFDASAGPVRRLIENLTEDLLIDPEGAAAEALANPHLPEVVASALHEALELEGVERSRYILRVFGGARLMIRVRDRITNGGLSEVLADPPSSSEHLLHPDRYLAGLASPVTVERGRRAGLLGRGLQLAESGPVGERGLLGALAACLPWPEAASAADGWAGDLLTAYRPRNGGAGTGSPGGLAWRIVFRSESDARVAASALKRAIQFSQGGTWVLGGAGGLILDEDSLLEGAATAVRLRRDERSVALVLGGDVEKHPSALEDLMAETCKHPGSRVQSSQYNRGFRSSGPKKSVTPGSTHDPLYRGVRVAASPIYYDETGRFDHRMRSLYGFLARHRTWPEAGAVEMLNPNGFPILGWMLPDEARGLLFAGERSDDRWDTSVFMDWVRGFRNENHDISRFWSPLFSRTHGPDYRSWSLLYGALFELEDGAGRYERSPRVLYSRETGLNGAERSFGVLLDLISYRTRAGRDKRVAIAPEGVLAWWTGFEDPSGFELALLAESLLLRRRAVLPGTSHLDFSLLWGNAMRLLSDDASGRGEFSVARGLGFGLYSTPRRTEFGVGRIWRRSVLGFGSEDGRGFMDFLFLRFGG